MTSWTIRKREKKDNPAVAKLIRAVFDELEIPKVGTAYEDPYLDLMFEEYSKPRSVYFVVEQEDEVVGCAGIAPLANEKETICELQKMYFLPATRGKGIGKEAIQFIQREVPKLSLKLLYLEVEPHNENAQKLYLAHDFEFHNRKLMKYKVTK